MGIVYAGGEDILHGFFHLLQRDTLLEKEN